MRPSRWKTSVRRVSSGHGPRRAAVAGAIASQARTARGRGPRAARVPGTTPGPGPSVRDAGPGPANPLAVSLGRPGPIAAAVSRRPARNLPSPLGAKLEQHPARLLGSLQARDQEMSLVLAGYRQGIMCSTPEPSQLILRYLTVTFQLSLDRLPRREHTPVPGNARPRPVRHGANGPRYLRSAGGQTLPGGDLPKVRAPGPWLHR